MSTLILSCSTGQGHNSCAKAIKEFYDQQGEPCNIEDALGFISKSFSNFICWGHTTIYRHLHGLFQLGYHFSEKHSDMFTADSGIYKLLCCGADRLYAYIQQGHYTAVICTHVFASLIMTEVRKRYHLPIVTTLVATDYTCNPGTKESIVDHHFIPESPLSVYYACSTIKESQITCCGIPIRQMFYQHINQNDAKAAFHIPPAHKHLLMMCGSMGCGPMKKMAYLISKSGRANIDLSIVCGTNSHLKDALQRKYAKNSNIHIYGYVANMSQLMDSADLYLTKPGGISVTEASAKNLPMVFIDAVAGCEEYNKIYFIRKGAALTGINTREITSTCLELLSDPDKLSQMRRNLENTPKANASAIIYKKMNELMENNTYAPIETRS